MEWGLADLHEYEAALVRLVKRENGDKPHD